MNSFAEHSDVLMWIISGLLTLVGLSISVVGWFAVRTLRQIDGNQQKLTTSINQLWSCLDALCKDFYKLQGQHDAICKGGLSGSKIPHYSS